VQVAVAPGARASGGQVIAERAPLPLNDFSVMPSVVRVTLPEFVTANV